MKRWTCGLRVLLYEFLVGEAPFNDTPVMTQKRITKADIRIPLYVSPEATNLIKKVSHVVFYKELNLRL
ncbi:hypothetical protein F4680DRAFT_432871, partial [Xylaria scruposa]